MPPSKQIRINRSVYKRVFALATLADILDWCDLCEQLPPLHPGYKAALCSMSVAYARLFDSTGNSIGSLTKEFCTFSNPDFKAVHGDLIMSRMKVFGHSDGTAKTTEAMGGERNLHQVSIIVSEQPGGIGIAFATPVMGINADKISVVRDLCNHQMERLRESLKSDWGTTFGGPVSQGTYVLHIDKEEIKKTS